MPIDVSGSSRPRQPDPLSDSDRARLQTLAGKGDRTPAEGYELGSLKARARHDPGSRRVLEDLTHQTPPPQQPQRLAWNLVPARPRPSQEPPMAPPLTRARSRAVRFTPAT